MCVCVISRLVGTDQNKMKNETTVKYVCLEEYDYPEEAGFHDVIRAIEDASNKYYESKVIHHETFVEMHDKVIKECPETYKCIEPIATYHQLLWSIALSKKGDKLRRKQDTLHHAIDEMEYELLNGKFDEVWVDIVKIGKERYDMSQDLIDEGGLTSSDRLSQKRPEVPQDNPTAI